MKSIIWTIRLALAIVGIAFREAAIMVRTIRTAILTILPGEISIAQPTLAPRVSRTIVTLLTCPRGGQFILGRIMTSTVPCQIVMCHSRMHTRITVGKTMIMNVHSIHTGPVLLSRLHLMIILSLTMRPMKGVAQDTLPTRQSH